METKIFKNLDEQIEIMRYIAEYRDGTKAYCDVLTQEIAALQELKTRIVFDAVTGKMDVRNIEIPNYEYFDEEPDAVDSAEEAEEQEGE